MSLPRLILVLLALAVTGHARSAEATERTLTKAIEVRSLSRAEAEQGIPVHLRGVVVFIESPSALFLQDDTSTTFFRLETPKTPPRDVALPRIGDDIELTAKTRMGLYLPGVDYAKFKVLGQRPLPPGIPATYDDLHFGRYHYQRVSVEGIVRSVVSVGPENNPTGVVRLAMGSRIVEARVEKAPPADLALIGHRVRITGLSAGLINTPRRQMVQPYLRVLDWNEIDVLAAAPAATEVPEISAGQLLAFQVDGLGEQRVRLTGRAIAVFGPDQVFVRQDQMAFSVRLGTPAVVQPGDEVSVVGFPAMDRFSASVVDAEVVARTPGAAPPPVDVASIEELYGKDDPQPGRLDGNLVRLTATVRDAFKSEEGTTLLLQNGKRTIQARMPDSESLPPFGSLVRFTGICQVESAVGGNGFASKPGLVSLRAALPALEVLRTPPWWTTRRLLVVLAALGGVTLVSGLWIAALRRQVRRQTTALRHRIEAEAALEERQRIAREFHDTLEQELAGVSLRLDALATRIVDDKGRSLVAASRNLVSRIQVETRELISDLRDSTETAGDLAAALALVAARHSADGDAEVKLALGQALPALPATVVHDLRMMAREAVTNARKHGRARHVTLAVDATEGKVRLRIVDDGCGFDPAAALPQRRGHFGCAGMRERGRKIGADVAWQSAPGHGTTVEISLPWQTVPSTPAPLPTAATPAPAEREPADVRT